MNRPAALALLPLLVFALPARAGEIACAGPLAMEASLADLETAFGKANVVTSEQEGDEGETYTATMVFPDDAERSFTVYWTDEANRKGVSGFTVPAADTAPGGVRVGMTLKQVQELNGEPFTVWGFWWDYGGGAGFDSGKLANLPGGCFLSLAFTPQHEPADQAVYDAIAGDKELRSDMKELEAADPIVSDITIGYPDPASGDEDEDDV